ncbi:MAG: hypothetical protein K0R94_1521 [Burkholderiales bacterium]|jgi:hypothetical protein|nr:hypothetical protein [Burkholderiales bacterium]
MYFDIKSNLKPCIKLDSNNRVILIDNNLLAQVNSHLPIKLFSKYTFIKTYGQRHIKCL